MTIQHGLLVAIALFILSFTEAPSSAIALLDSASAPPAPAVHPETTWLVIAVAIAAYLIIYFFSLHTTLCYLACKSTEEKFSTSCADCCFDGPKGCYCLYWRWHPAAWVMTRWQQLSRICPTGIDRHIPRQRATKELSHAYRKNLPMVFAASLGVQGLLLFILKLLGIVKF